MYQSTEELLSEMQKAREIIAQRSDIQDLSIEDLLNVLDDGSQEMRHYRWNIAAILYVKKLEKYTYDYLATELVAHNFSEHLCGYIMFLLQKEHNICSITLSKAALQHETFLQIFPFVQGNIRYENIIKKDNIIDFFYVMPNVPPKKEYYFFLDFSQKIVENSLEDYTFAKLIKSKPEKARILLCHLIEQIYRKNTGNGDSYLSTLLHSTEAIYWIDVIVAGIMCSLRVHVDIFEECFCILQEIKREEQAWEKLIPCYVEYVFCQEKNVEINRNVLDCLREIEKSSAEDILIFIRTISCQKDISTELETIRQSICKTPFEKKEEALAAMADYYYHFRLKMDTENVLKELHNTFVINDYNIANYHGFFDSFQNLWPEYNNQQSIIWQYFISALYDKKEESVAFALGLFEYAITYSENIKQISELRINENSACLTIKLLSALSLHYEQVCLFSFELSRFLLDNSPQYIDAFFDDIYLSYPHTCQKIAKKYGSSPFCLQHEIARQTISRYQQECDDQAKWRTVPDLWPSLERQMIARSSAIQQNKKINKMAQEESVFAQLFSNHVMKYGKRSGFIKRLGHNNYAYQTSEYMSFETSMELSAIYTKAPVEWYLKRKKALEERRNYVETHH